MHKPLSTADNGSSTSHCRDNAFQQNFKKKKLGGIKDGFCMVNRQFCWGNPPFRGGRPFRTKRGRGPFRPPVLYYIF